MKVEINANIGRIELYQTISTLFLTAPIPKQLLMIYLYHKEDDDLVVDVINEMIEFIASHLKDECAFSTSIPIMDAIENIMTANEGSNITIID